MGTTPGRHITQGQYPVRIGRHIIHGQYPVRSKGHKECQYHRENEVVLLCQDCNTLICISCSITSHKKHIDNFLEIKKIANTQTNILRDFVKDTDDIKIPKLNKNITLAKKALSTYQQRAATELLQTRITNLEERLDTLVKLSSECKQTLQTGTVILMYDLVSEIQDMHLDGTQQTSNIAMIDVTPCKDRQNQMERSMDKLKTPTAHLQTASTTGGHSIQGPVVRPKQSKSSGTSQASTGAVLYKLCDSPTVISQFSYPNDISSICPTPDGRAWLCDYDTNTVNLINNKGQVIQKIQHNSNIRNISLDPTTGRLWFCCMSERTIHEVSTSSTPVTRFTTERHPISLCVTREGRVVVGTLGTQEYEVVMYTAYGRVLHSVTVEGSGAGCVQSITQCDVTGNMAVVSSKLISGGGSDPANWRRHIIVYNPTLQPLVYYHGEGIQAREAVTPDTFGPVRVVYDSKGNIVIAERTRKTIELISGAGKYINTLHTNKGRQWAVGIQKNDVLWSFLEVDTENRGLKLLKYYRD